jgi:hypothetical protein
VSETITMISFLTVFSSAPPRVKTRTGRSTNHMLPMLELPLLPRGVIFSKKLTVFGGSLTSLHYFLLAFHPILTESKQ